MRPGLRRLLWGGDGGEAARVGPLWSRAAPFLSLRRRAVERPRRCRQGAASEPIARAEGRLGGCGGRSRFTKAEPGRVRDGGGLGWFAGPVAAARTLLPPDSPCSLAR